ncbi:antitoxin family protein [Pirellulimonas nuda]|uniref:antitoxin family protein n=1 Tax=Pirellulimonas nuda TaxID=2528009 RepID=UPI0011A92DED
MSQPIPAIFDRGVFRPLGPVDLVEGTRVDVSVPQQTARVDRSPRPSDDDLSAGAAAWSEFVRQAYGSCAGLGLERPDQAAFEPREPIQ